MERYNYREVDGEILPPDEGVYLDETLLHEAAVDLHDEFYTEWYEQQAAEAASPAVPVRLAEEYRQEELWAVDSKERALGFIAVADVYAARAESDGLQKYSKTKRGAADLARRYDDPVDVVEGARVKNLHAHDKARSIAVKALGYDVEKWKANKYLGNDDAIIRSYLRDIRETIGNKVEGEDRDKIRNKFKKIASGNVTPIELDFPKFL